MLNIQNLDKVDKWIVDYSNKKNELDRITKRLSDVYNEEPGTEIYATDMKYLHTLEDLQFSALIEAVCIYEDLIKFLGRAEEDENNQFMLRKIRQRIEALDPIQADFEWNFLPEDENV